MCVEWREIVKEFGTLRGYFQIVYFTFVAMETQQKYSESVNAMNGCLLGCLEIFSKVCLILVVILLAPFFGLLLLCWWIVAWILGLIFPGREFFPFKRMWSSFSAWFKRQTGEELSDVLTVAAIVLLVSSALDGLSGFFSGKK